MQLGLVQSSASGWLAGDPATYNIVDSCAEPLTKELNQFELRSCRPSASMLFLSMVRIEHGSHFKE
jgi:hypothetical protein